MQFDNVATAKGRDEKVTYGDALILSGDVNNLKNRIDNITDGGSEFDTISELTAGAGVTIDGVLLKDSQVTTDVVNEKTAAAGVTVDSALIKDGSFIGKQATATATAAGLTTGALTGSDQFVSVTSGSIDSVITMPSNALCPVGTVIRGWVGDNGVEIRSAAADTTVAINTVTMGITNEVQIPATTFFTLTKVRSLDWILTATDELGAVITALIPDAI